MALVISNSSSVLKPLGSFRGDRKPWMLKDFLLDDLGSCSSGGFRSLPRRQCCVAVRNLIEMEARSTSRRLFNVSSKSSSSSKISNAIQRASRAVISAVKLLPLKSSAPVSAKGKKKTSLLPRSLSKKLFGKSLWKKSSPDDNDRSSDCEIERWISSGAAAAEKYQPSELSNETTASTAITITSASTTSSTNSDSWSESDSEFTQPRSSIDENDVVERKRISSAKIKRCATVRNESVRTATPKKKWSNEDEKEQSSPISVLSFPDEDEEIESSSPFTRKINHSEGTKEKLMQKLRHFECLSRIGKIKLEPRLSLPTNDSERLYFQSPPSPLHVIEEEETKEKVAERLLNRVKSKTTSFNAHKLNPDNLLIGFFLEGLVKLKARGKEQSLVEDALLVEAEDWLCGRSSDELSTGWKVKEKRKLYVKDMEEGGEWARSNFHELEKEDVGVQVEDEVFASLVDEMVGELSNLELLNFLLK